MNTAVNNPALRTYPVWDRTVRVFHWLNVVCLLGLIGLGLMIYFNKNFGVSPEGKILLKTLHTYVGYVFVVNLSWRILWGFMGSRHARWTAIIPFGKGYKKALSAYLQGLRDKCPPAYLGHNPLARLMISTLFILLMTQAVTGLVLAGTDLYMPPFGNQIAEWVSVPGELDELKAGSKDHVDAQAYKAMRAFRKPFINTHKYSFYLLVLCIALHITAVVISELSEKNGLISAMFTGKKVFADKPVDVDIEDQK